MKKSIARARCGRCLAISLFAFGLPSCGSDDPTPTDQVRHAHVLGSASNGGTHWTPLDYRKAYNVPSPGPEPGESTTIVIVAYHYPNLQADLNKFAAKYALRAPTLSIINQAGSKTNSEWALEATIDVEMVIAANEMTQLYVIEAKSDSSTDIQVAIETAETLARPGTAVSMSFGASELAGGTTRQGHFSSTQITWIAASGDNLTPSFPSTYPG
ncbi:MAG TPA: hypothetical protein VGC79_04530, partial [Polyangiaceae bacterium]